MLGDVHLDKFLSLLRQYGMHDQNILFFKISRKYKPDTDNKTRMCQRIDPLLAMCRQLFFDLINVSIADTTTAEVKAQSGELCIFILAIIILPKWIMYLVEISVIL